MSKDRFPPSRQRPAILPFVSALNAADDTLRRDECGDWRINGKKGHIYATPVGVIAGYEKRTPSADGPGVMVGGTKTNWLLCVSPGSAMAWSYVKKAFAPFAMVINDGDDEGVFRMDRLPSADEAVTIRQYLKIRKRVEYSPETLERKREVMRAAQRQRALTASGENAQKPASAEGGATLVPEAV